MINGIKSCSFNTDESLCGAVYLAPDNKAIVPLKSLNGDVSTYLRLPRRRLASGNGNLSVTEEGSLAVRMKNLKS